VIAFGVEQVQRTFVTMWCVLHKAGFWAIMAGVLAAEVRCTWPIPQMQLPCADAEPALTFCRILWYNDRESRSC